MFYQRLRDRGYPSSFLLPVFDSIFYSDRNFFLWPSATLHLHPQLISHPPQSKCLQRRIQRWKRQQSALNLLSAQQPPPVFVIPYSPLSRLIPTRSLLCKYWELVQEATESSISKPIIAYQSSPSLVKTLVYSRARQMNELRTSSTVALPVAKQSLLDRFFIKSHAQTHSN